MTQAERDAIVAEQIAAGFASLQLAVLRLRVSFQHLQIQAVCAASICDDVLEKMIAEARADLERATTPEGRRNAWVALKALHKLRSPEQVRRMERAKGLV